MSRHSIEPIDFIFVKGDGFLSFAKKNGYRYQWKCK